MQLSRGLICLQPNDNIILSDLSARCKSYLHANRPKATQIRRQLKFEGRSKWVNPIVYKT